MKLLIEGPNGLEEHEILQDGSCGTCNARHTILPKEALGPKNFYAICDYGWDGFMVYGPYYKHEAIAIYPNDAVVQLVYGLFSECYPA